MKRVILWVILILVVGALAYVRLAPSDPARWNQQVTETANTTMQSGAVRVIPAGDETFERLDVIMRDLPRTDVLAGSVAEGRVTYITRSKWMGFPDYTTIDREGDELRLYARSRFGQSDLGVNIARLQNVLGQL
jgi:uncharacterized protein (DUF1499 family)